MTICKNSVYRYGFALAAVALSFPLKTILIPLIGREVSFLLFSAATIISTWYGGIGPGLLASFSSMLLHGGLIPPTDPLPMSERFFLKAFLITSLSAAWGAARHRAAATKEENRQLRRKMEQCVSEQTGTIETTDEDLENKMADRIQREEDLRTALSLVNAALESTTDGLLVVDQTGKIRTFNRKFVDMWQIPPEIIASQDDNQSIKLCPRAIEGTRTVHRQDPGALCSTGGGKL